MKKTLLVLLVVVLRVVSSNAQVLTSFIDWERSFGGTGNDAAWSIVPTMDGGYIAAGESASNNGDVSNSRGGYDFWVVKTDGSGNLQWQKALGSSGNDYGRSIKQTTDGGYIVAGWASANNGDVTGNHGNSDFWVVKLDGSGAITWQKSMGGGGYDYAYSVQQTAEGGYIVVGETSSVSGDVTSNHGGIDVWVVKLGETGDIQWQKTYGGTGDDYGYSIVQTTDSGYVVVGQSTSSDGDLTNNYGFNDLWVFKINSVGTILWQEALGGSGYDYGQSVQQTFDGGFIIAGYTNSNDHNVAGNHGLNDYWVLKLDVDGFMQWGRCYGGSGDDDAYSVQQTADSGYIVAGQSNSADSEVTQNHGNYDYWIVKLDTSGNIVMEKSFGGTGNDYAYCVQQSADGGFVVAGSSNSTDGDVTGNHAGTYDYWIVKLGALVGLEEKNNPLSEFNVNPNPVSQSAYISFSLSAAENVTAKIYDVTGREIKNLLSTDLSQGFHQMEWNVNDNSGNSVSNGIYMLTIETPQGRDTRRVAVIR